MPQSLRPPLEPFQGSQAVILREAFATAWAHLSARHTYPADHPAVAALQSRLASKLIEITRTGVADPKLLALTAIDRCANDAAKLKMIVGPSQ